MLQRVARAQGHNERIEQLLRPMLQTSPLFYVFCGILLTIIIWFAYAWYIQLTHGLGVTAMRTPVGAAWGVYIASFVFFASMAHGGMAVSASVRLLKLRRLLPVARMGEVLTAVCLMMAGLSIVIDMGRPDRAFSMLFYWPQRVVSSPLSWDMTVIILYFTLSASYLWLTMRSDLLHCEKRFSRRGIIYRLLLIGYQPGEKERVDRLAWWLSIAIVFLIVMLSGGVIPWIFGLMSSRPGWFSALAGPYFLTAAIASSIAAVILVAGILRKVYHWQEHIDPAIFKGLSVFLGVVSLFYMYLTYAEQITMRYAAPEAETMVSEMLLQGELAPLYWGMLILGFIVPSLMLIIQAMRPGWFSITRTVLASGVIIAAFWLKRFFIVVPSLLRPLLPFPTGTYQPTWIEWSILAGTFAIAVLIYTLYLKILPIMELGEE
ncbi:MAG: polysulfide reductase NrfD [Chloroflexi bacterium]|nr:polysulfide reductase NrfD [Chloroflexota bacterium]